MKMTKATLQRIVVHMPEPAVVGNLHFQNATHIQQKWPLIYAIQKRGFQKIEFKSQISVIKNDHIICIVQTRARISPAHQMKTERGTRVKPNLILSIQWAVIPTVVQILEKRDR